ADSQPTVEQLKKALLEHGPVTASVYATPAFKKYKGGLFAEHFRPREGDRATTHVVLIVGWDDRRGRGAWKVQNSFGPKWGENGFMWIEYGSNNVGHHAAWLRAQSVAYRLPADAAQRAGGSAESFPAWPSAKDVKPASAAVLTVAEAAKKDGETVTLEMKVRGAAPHAAGHVDLYSEATWTHPDCFVVRLLKAALPKFEAKQVADPLTYYKGKTLRVQGRVRVPEKPKRPVIEVSDPDQVTVVE